jgi:hypothetical protein
MHDRELSASSEEGWGAQAQPAAGLIARRNAAGSGPGRQPSRRAPGGAAPVGCAQDRAGVHLQWHRKARASEAAGVAAVELARDAARGGATLPEAASATGLDTPRRLTGVAQQIANCYSNRR